MDGVCLTKGVIYKATVHYNIKKMILDQLTGSLKVDIIVHSFKHKSEKKNTKRSMYIRNTNVNKAELKKVLKWKILHVIKQSKPGKICILCNIGRIEIAFANTKRLLNSRTELIDKCKLLFKSL